MLESPVAEGSKNTHNGFIVAHETFGHLQYYKFVKTNVYAFEKLDITFTQQNHDSSTFSSLSA